MTRPLRWIGSGAAIVLVLVTFSVTPAYAGGPGGHQVPEGRWANVRTALSLCTGQTKSRQPIHVYGYIVIAGGKYATFGEIFSTRKPDAIVSQQKAYVPGGLAVGFAPSFGGVRPSVWGWIGGTLLCRPGAPPSLDAAEQRVR